MNKKLFAFLTCFFTFFIAGSAHANAGVPMIMLLWPMMWLTLIPIILIESVVLRKHFPQISFKRLLISNTWANLFSTLIGIPFAWLCAFLIEVAVLYPFSRICDHGTCGDPKDFPEILNVMLSAINIVIYSAWLMPVREIFHWLLPTAILILLAPCFYFSYKLESWAMGVSKIMKNVDPYARNKAMKEANIASYMMLYLLTIFFLLVGLVTKKDILTLFHL